MNEPRTKERFESGRLQWMMLVLFLLVIGAADGYDIYREFRRSEQWELERLQIQNRVIRENLVNNLETIDTVLAQLQKEFMHGAGHVQDKTDLLKRLTDAMPGVRTLHVTDAEGIGIAASKPDVIIGKDFSFRDYFKTPRSAPQPDILYISPPFKTLTGIHVLNATRAIIDPAGRFIGVVTATLDPAYFKTLLSSVLYADDMRASLIHPEGTVFMMLPGEANMAGGTMNQAGRFLSGTREVTSTVVTHSGWKEASGGDEMRVVSRVSHRRLKIDKPLLVTTERSLPAIRAAWQRDALVQGGLFGLLSVSSITGFFLFRKRQQQHQEFVDRAATELLAQKEEIDRFFSLSLDLLCIADNQGHFRKLNTAWEATLGYPLAELERARFLDFVHPDDLDATLAAMKNLSAEKPVINFVNRYRCHDGSYRWIEWRSRPYGADVVYAAARDITDRKLAEDRIIASERFLRMLTDHLPGMVGYWTDELRCGFANCSYLEWFGKTPEEMRGIQIRDLMGEELFHKNEPYMRAALRGEAQSFERTLTKPDGSIGHTWAHYVPDIDQAGTVRGFFVLVSDVTELKRAMEEIKVLQGIIPICAGCKKIRDDQGYWNQLEAYISEHSDAVFSHGLCPSCCKELYPQQYAAMFPEKEST